MAAEWLATLEGTALVRALRDSVWVYPLVNAGHVLGVALLVGAIVPLDLRLLGVWRTVPLLPLWRVLTRAAATGLCVAMGFGVLLFATRATEYAVSGFFLAKITLVGIATANALALRTGASMRWLKSDRVDGPVPPTVRVAAAVSLACWLTVLVLGRLVGYF